MRRAYVTNDSRGTAAREPQFLGEKGARAGKPAPHRDDYWILIAFLSLSRRDFSFALYSSMHWSLSTMTQLEVIADLHETGADRLAGGSVLVLAEVAADAAAVNAHAHAVVRRSFASTVRVYSTSPVVVSTTRRSIAM